ncbi:AI-2E family transporter [Halostella litorea]|uniref:AI-2E family transporter n=1 Tax=Halostella litorea TaxID=2528831 RepID=UPI001092C5AE|nr:AI-2E family transporter [Halostella litorea]
MASTGAAPGRERVAWWGVAAVLFAALAFVAYTYVGTLVLGLFVYYATRRIHRRTRRRVQPPSLAAIVSLATIAAPILLLLGYALVIAAREADEAVPNGYTSALEPYVDAAWLQDPQQVLADLVADPGRLGSLGSPENALDAASTVASSLGVVVNVVVHLFIALTVGFYLLRDDRRLAGWVRGEFVGRGSTADAFLTAVDRNLEAIYFGNILFAAANAVVATVAYNALDLVSPAAIAVPAPTLLGLLTGVGSLVPVVGMKIVWVPAALYLLAVAAATDPELLWFGVAFAVVTFVVVDTVPEVLLRPYISGRDLHVGLVLFAYIFGPLLFGWYGIFLGPLVLVVAVEFARIVLPELVRGEPLTAAAAAEEPTGLDAPDPETVVPDDGDAEDDGHAEGGDATGATDDAAASPDRAAEDAPDGGSGDADESTAE